VIDSSSAGASEPGDWSGADQWKLPLQTAFQRDTPYNDLPKLPPRVDVETKRTLKKAIAANRALAELRGVGGLIPNQGMLIRSVVLQEAKLSSEIENIVTTNDKLYRAFSELTSSTDPNTKEVLHYGEALWHGYRTLKEGRPLSAGLFVQIVGIIREAGIGIRTMPGTQIANERTGKVVYTPPEGEGLIRDLLDNLSEPSTRSRMAMGEPGACSTSSIW
jgi:Fic family protein